MKRCVIGHLKKRWLKNFKFDVNHQHPYIQKGEQTLSIVFSDSPRYITLKAIPRHAAAKATASHITVDSTLRHATTNPTPRHSTIELIPRHATLKRTLYYGHEGNSSEISIPLF